MSWTGFFPLGKRKHRESRPQSIAPQLTLFAGDAGAGAEPKAAFPQFRATAADQIDQRRADPMTLVRLKLRAAFTPAQPVTDRQMFAGRIETLKALISSIEDRKLHLVLYGPRGIGKTSLLHILATVASEAKYIVHYSSCGAASNFSETFRAAAQAVPLLFHRDFGPTTEEAESGAALADLLPPGQFSPRQFGDLCAGLTGTRMLIVMDEFDRSKTPEFRRELAELIKILSDRSARVQLVIAGVAADFAELVEHIPSIRRNILAARLPHMTDPEVAELIAAGERATGLVFDAGARDYVVRIARGWPYIASLICHHAGLESLDDNRTTVKPEDIAGAVNNALDELRTRIPQPIQVRVEELVRAGFGKHLMLAAGAALSGGGTGVETADIDALGSKGVETSSVKQLVEHLAREGTLLRPTTEGSSDSFLFTEDGLPPFLWFRGVRDELQVGRRPRASNG